MKPYLYIPGVPAAGHISSGGWWHPSRIEGCPKCPSLATEASGVVESRPRPRPGSSTVHERTHTMMNTLPAPVEPTETRRVTITSLRDAGSYIVVTVLGVAVGHELWISEGGEEAYYVEAPTSGPIEWLQRWAAAEHEVRVWTFDVRDYKARYESQLAAEMWVHLTAANEVRTELI